MAKKQTFESKLNKSSDKKNQVKLIRSFYSQETQSIRFSEEMVTIPEGKSVDSHLKEIVSK